MIRINKLKQKYIIGLFVTIFLLLSFYNPNNDKQRVLVHFLHIALQLTHYSPSVIDDDLSKEIFDDYIERLDYFKLYFTEPEYNELKKSRTLLDDQIKNRDLKFYNSSLALLKKNIQRAKEQMKEVLEIPFDFSKDEYLNADYETLEYAKNDQELKNRWRKRLKYVTLIEILNRLELEKDSISEEKEHIQGINENQSWEKIEAKERAEVLSDYLDYFKRIEDRTDMDWISIYLTTFAESFDPHTSYFPPKDKESFDISISGTYEGIGARLTQRSGYITVVEVMAGGPGYRQGELEVDDKILKVAQGNEKPVDIVGVRTDDAIKLIKGKKKTIVKLTVKKIDGTIKVIPIIRDVVELEETFAKSSVIEKNGRKYGFIYVPKFYFDIKHSRSGRNGADDVKYEIEELKKDEIEGLVFDLRSNGGGSLDVAVNMTGLFIEKGPVVQIKERKGLIKTKYDDDPSVVWDGPMVVLVNELSASASEILTAALQDYKRAIVIGSQHTYGKGTVQGFLPLGGKNNDLGFAKITMQKYYRVNGGATQLKGVLSDIVLPTKYKYVDVGEEEQENAMAWDQITPAKYNVWGQSLNIDIIKEESNQRVSHNKYFSLLDESAKYLKERSDQNDHVSLNKETYEKEQDQIEMDLEKFKDLKNYDNGLVFKSTIDEIFKSKTDTILKSKRKAWHKRLKKDAYIEESVNILEDINRNNLTNALSAKK